jgi:hypothetical protein
MAIVAVEKQPVLRILCVSVALVIQRSKLTRHTTLSSVACLSLPYLSVLFYKPHDIQVA